MSRLSATDAFWMNAEPDGPPFAIGALVVLEGPGPSLSALRALVADWLSDAERMRQRLQVDPSGMRHQRWVPAEPDLDHHVSALDLPDTGDDAQLERAVSELLAAPMDYDRPLWDLTLLTGLQHERWAIVSRVHHTVADGHGALMLTGRIIDADPAGTTSLTEALDQLITARAAARAEAQATSTPEPTDPDDTPAHEDVPATEPLPAPLRVVEAARRGSDLVARALATATATAESLQRSAGAVAAHLPGSAGVLAGDPGQGRTWTTTTVPMIDVARIRATFGGTVNDVVMALMSGAYRALLVDLGVDPDEEAVRVLVPVSLRNPGDLSANNQISALLVTLPWPAAPPNGMPTSVPTLRRSRISVPPGWPHLS